MKADKILPIDLYHTVPTAELVLERALRIVHIAAGQEYEQLSFEPGTLVIICTGGTFACKALQNSYTITVGQVLLLASTDLTEVTPLSHTHFEGILIYAGEELMVNRQRLTRRVLLSGQIEEAELYIQLIHSQIERISDTRSKVVESLLRALLISLQQAENLKEVEEKKIPSLFREFAMLISRFHHSPTYYYAEKMGMTSQELNTHCKAASGMSAAEWISHYVLLEAKDLLTKTRLRPSQIAALLNFSNYDTFARWFRRHTGDMPGDRR